MCVCARARMCVCVCVSARERVNQRTCILLGGCSDKMCTGVLVRMIWRQALVASLYSLHSTHLFAGQRRRFHLHWVVVWTHSPLWLAFCWTGYFFLISSHAPPLCSYLLSHTRAHICTRLQTPIAMVKMVMLTVCISLSLSGTHTHTRTHTRTHAHMHTHTHTHTRLVGNHFTQIWVNYSHAYTHYTHACTYLHTHTRIYISTRTHSCYCCNDHMHTNLQPTVITKMNVFAREGMEGCVLVASARCGLCGISWSWTRWWTSISWSNSTTSRGQASWDHR